jgi:hypothetical protein
MRRKIVATLLMMLSSLAAPGAVVEARKEPPGSRPALPDLRPLGKSLWQSVAALKRLEIVEMVTAIAGGSDLGPNSGWFHPAQSRYSWKWLASRFDANKDGKIERREFPGSDDLFNRLDRDHDGVLTPADFDWSDRSPLARRASMARTLFHLFDANSNGRVSREEWDAFFARLSAGKGYFSPDDLREAMERFQLAKKDGSKNKGPSPLVFLKGLLCGELGSPFEGPRVGQTAPDFTLETFDGKRHVTLSQFRGKKPVVLVFGSFT